ncbi:hypothetical protein AMTR_s00101p00092980 [Amborella trichopoda]|uniref:RNA helicase n=2 Tax=Amborella trichopoda TaxID=13333 RepID=W1NUS7_AMBTC|nr:hypothetical protein AMTR_s00101p00092980 [Amborella trichopoda]
MAENPDIFDPESDLQLHFSLENGDNCNASILPKKKKKKAKKCDELDKSMAKSTPPLSKSQKRKLMKLQIGEEVQALLRPSGNIAQVETMKEKLRRALQYSRVGLPVPDDVPLLKKRTRVDASCQEEDFTMKAETSEFCLKRAVEPPRYIETKNKPVVSISVFSSNGSEKNMLVSFGDPPAIPREHDGLCKDRISQVGLEKNMQVDLRNPPDNPCRLASKDPNTQREVVTNMQVDIKDHPVVPCGLDDEGKDPTSQNQSQGADESARHSSNSGAPLACNEDDSFSGTSVVHVLRPAEVETKRIDLPVVMMEQEIMEAINEHSTVIVCGETGCGKTTQVPQFLYEAGFGSSNCITKKGMIGVTQPRRVAVLATAKRVSYELGVRLGREVGFQVRHDRRMGDCSSIKFMTDGILLKEVQSDFLLKRYSVIILDEAHERSLNTDILIGMLSRIIGLRQKLYEEQQVKLRSGSKLKPENMFGPLKLVLMSATLRIEDFVSNSRLFHAPPPLIEIPTRQFPVSIHFSRKTEMVDYLGQAYKKVMSIHKKLPPGGILVFLTGLREVEHLCRKLRKASGLLRKRISNGKAVDKNLGFSEQDPDMKSICEASENTCKQGIEESHFFNSHEEDVDIPLSDSESSEVESEEFESDDEIITMESGKVLDILKEPGSLSSLKAAFENLAGNSSSAVPKEDTHSPNEENIHHVSNGNNESPTIKKEGSTENPNKVASPLYVLPLYAMLPAPEQLRVFGSVPEGERLVVVATNVAETSLTIPGIKYVVDSGREKVKNYEGSSGVAKFEIQWISKASASQRAGRAGRTGPGHCYRLYSSAVFNNIFPDFSTPEISKTPVDGVFLVMKSMGIDKVANFPFPTPPESAALAEAEQCLKVLDALDSKGRLTPLGKAMARYPISPRHSRMILTAIQIMNKKPGYARANLVLAFTVAAAAALSSINPFLVDHHDTDRDREKKTLGDDMGNRAKEGGDDVGNAQAKLGKKKQRALLKASRKKFSNPSSDALTLANALCLFEASEKTSEFCLTNRLHLKTMDDMSKLRKQLLQLIFSQVIGGDEEQSGFSWSSGNFEDVEIAWRNSMNTQLLLNEEGILGQAICAGWADRVARRIRQFEEIPEGAKRSKSVRYQSCVVKETVFLHRSSSAAPSAPEFVVYNELLQTSRPFMHGITSVRPAWLIAYASSLCTFSAPLSDPKPFYEPFSDQILCWVNSSFGPYLWELPLHNLPVKSKRLRVSVFACSLLGGKVLPCLKDVQKFLAANPESLLKPEAQGQRRVGELLNRLVSGSRVVDSRAALKETWRENPLALHEEIVCWFQEGFRFQFGELWEQMQREVELEAEVLFPKRKKRNLNE